MLAAREVVWNNLGQNFLADMKGKQDEFNDDVAMLQDEVESFHQFVNLDDYEMVFDRVEDINSRLAQVTADSKLLPIVRSCLGRKRMISRILVRWQRTGRRSTICGLPQICGRVSMTAG